MDRNEVLVTGSTGFIGGWFLKKYSDHYNIKTTNLRVETPEKLNMTGVKTIIHFAALVHQMKGAPHEQYFSINTKLTRSLALKAKSDQVEHFILLSTVHVYGQFDHFYNALEYFTETSLCLPTDPYGQSKLAAEKVLLDLQDENFKVSIIRAPLVYGPGGKGNLNNLKKLITLFPFLPFRYMKNKRSLVFVENLVYFIHLLIQNKKSGVFLVQDEKPISIQEFVLFIAKALNKKVYLFQIPNLLFLALYRLKPNIMQRLFGNLALNSEQSIKATGYHPIFTTAEAFKLTFSTRRK